MSSPRTHDWHGFLAAQIWNQIMSKEQYFNVDWCRWQGGDVSDSPAAAASQRGEVSVLTIISLPCTPSPVLPTSAQFCLHQCQWLRALQTPIKRRHKNLLPPSVCLSPCHVLLSWTFFSVYTCLVRLSWLYLSVCRGVTRSVVQLSGLAPIFPIWGPADIYFDPSPILACLFSSFTLSHLFTPILLRIFSQDF